MEAKGPGSEPPALSCLLCQSQGLRILDQLSGLELRTLWELLGRQFTSEAWGSIRPDVVVQLWRCDACGFQFHDPRFSGSEEFYRQLEYEGYFSEARPEFARTISFAKRQRLGRVLDVGCGTGTFLDLARRSGLETCGVELNREAARRAAANGHTIYEDLLGNLSKKTTAGGFDLITLFQVLEHVSDPVGLMCDAARLLKEKGCISVAVPNAEGVYELAPLDPHQWPPHHISRWRLRDFPLLGKRSDLGLTAAGGDQLLGSTIEAFWLLQNRLAPAVGRKPRLGGPFLPKLVSLVYRKSGSKFWFPRWGNSLYAFFTPTQPSP
jgi:SAM-dependent methyltransferase